MMGTEIDITEMTQDTVRARIAKLTAEIRRHDRAYYELDAPQISDAA